MSAHIKWGLLGPSYRSTALSRTGLADPDLIFETSRSWTRQGLLTGHQLGPAGWLNRDLHLIGRVWILVASFKQKNYKIKRGKPWRYIEEWSARQSATFNGFSWVNRDLVQALRFITTSVGNFHQIISNELLAVWHEANRAQFGLVQSLCGNSTPTQEGRHFPKMNLLD